MRLYIHSCTYENCWLVLSTFDLLSKPLMLFRGCSWFIEKVFFFSFMQRINDNYRKLEITFKTSNQFTCLQQISQQTRTLFFFCFYDLAMVFPVIHMFSHTDFKRYRFYESLLWYFRDPVMVRLAISTMYNTAQVLLSFNV